MKVAVVQNSQTGEVINRFGQACQEKYGRASVDRVVQGLREGGHTVELFEGDARLLDRLRSFIPPVEYAAAPSGMVFNMAYGIQGECRYTHVPAMLEMAGVPYTGSGPLGHALALDKALTKTLIRDAGISTPKWIVADRPGREPHGLRFPLVVKPRHESTSFGLHFVDCQRTLEDAIQLVLTQYEQEALVEEYVAGKEVCIGLLGNEPVECLPIVELDFGRREVSALTWEDKMHLRSDEPQKRCPAALPEDTAAKLRQIAAATFRACYCRDYARVDIRIDTSGQAYVLEINSIASLGSGASYVLSAMCAGYSLPQLACRILDVAHRRYFGLPAPQGPLQLQDRLDNATLATVGPAGSAPDFDAVAAEQATAQVVAVRADNRPPLKPVAAAHDSATANSLHVQADQPFCGDSPAEVVQRDPNTSMALRRVTRFFDHQIRESGYYEQLRRIVEPSQHEISGTGEWDTSGESADTVLTGLQHKFPQTALILATARCFCFCRFCFRKRLSKAASNEVAVDYPAIAAYVRQHSEITNVLISGGDPLILSSKKLKNIVEHFLPISRLDSIRFGTKSIVFYPKRFHDERLLDLFKRILDAGKVPVVVTHVDHVGEVSAETEQCVGRLRAIGVELFNQAVLLNKVNDDPDVLAATFRRLHHLGIRPYYLFQARPVRQGSHFQVPLARGIRIVQEVHRRLSGMEKTFRYVMSHGTGKIEILDLAQDGRLYLRYHQSTDPSRMGKVFWRPCGEDTCWVDPLPEETEVGGGLLCRA